MTHPLWKASIDWPHWSRLYFLVSILCNVVEICPRDLAISCPTSSTMMSYLASQDFFYCELNLLPVLTLLSQHIERWCRTHSIHSNCNDSKFISHLICDDSWFLKWVKLFTATHLGSHLPIFSLTSPCNSSAISG